MEMDELISPLPPPPPPPIDYYPLHRFWSGCMENIGSHAPAQVPTAPSHHQPHHHHHCHRLDHWPPGRKPRHCRHAAAAAMPPAIKDY